MASTHTPEAKSQQTVKKQDETITIDTYSSSSQNLQDTQETLTATDSTWLTDLQNKLSPAMLYIVSLAQFIDTVNGSSMTVALVAIGKDLEFATYNIQWIISAYIVTFGGFLLLSGRIGDLYGHRRVFLVGQIWFGVWSLAVSFATTPAMFCVFRALQGIGASMSVPTALGLITTTFPAGPKRTKALSIFSGFGALGAVVGLLIAGAFISSIGWAWIFRFSAIFSFILFFLGLIAIPTKTKAVKAVDAPKKKIDIAGALTATFGMICIIYYISTGSGAGWISVQTLPVLAAGIVLLGLFAWIELRWVDQPIMPFRIWRLRNFSSAFVAILFLQGQFQGFCYYATLIFQNIFGYDSIHTALAFLSHSIFAIVTFTVLGKILPKFKQLKPFILTGFFFRCVAALMFAFVSTTNSYWGLPFCGLLVHVLGLGASLLPTQIIALKDAKNEDQGVVGALFSMGLQLGSPLGLAIVTAISDNSVSMESTIGDKDLLLKSYRNGLFGVVGLGVLGFIVSAFLLPKTIADPEVAPVADAVASERTTVIELETKAEVEAELAADLVAGAAILEADPVETKINIESDARDTKAEI